MLFRSDAPEEANLGAIGVIIGHEITHAFDTSGAKFDKDGNLNNWWTEEDYRAFSLRANKVRKYYSEIEVLPGKYINGDLTVGENIADIGAFGCLLDVMADKEDADYQLFFESWARMWRSVNTQAYQEELLARDPHGPNKERVNEVLKQYEAFYETYDIQPTDGMYIEKEKRLEIW